MAGAHSESVADNGCFGCLVGILRGSLSESAACPQDSRSAATFGPSAREMQNVKDTLTGEAHCSGAFNGFCKIRLRGTEVFAEVADGAENERLHSVDCTGAHVACTGSALTLSRRSKSFLTMTFETEKMAGHWATKLAIVGGDSESISKLFSMQHRKIQNLEQTNTDAQTNNDQIERCLNFLSKEYVDMRHQVRTKKTKAIVPLAGEDLQEPQQEQFSESSSIGVKRQSEPEKEPLEKPDKETLLEVQSNNLVVAEQGPTLLSGAAVTLHKQAKVSARSGREAPESSPVGGNPSVLTARSPGASGVTECAAGRRSSRQLIANQRILNRGNAANVQANSAKRSSKDDRKLEKRAHTGSVSSLR